MSYLKIKDDQHFRELVEWCLKNDIPLFGNTLKDYNERVENSYRCMHYSFQYILRSNALPSIKEKEWKKEVLVYFNKKETNLETNLETNKLYPIY